MYYYHIVPMPVPGRGHGSRSGHCCAVLWVDVLLYTKMLIMTVPPCAPGTARGVPGGPREGMRRDECPSLSKESKERPTLASPPRQRNVAENMSEDSAGKRCGS